MPTAVIAHRTCPLDAPENSLQGLRLAGDLGSTGVEIDLRMSLDQRPYLMHDNSLARTTGFPLPLELTPTPLVRQLRLRNSVEGVPTLAQTLDALPDGLQLAVDVKTPWAVVPLVAEINRRSMQSRTLIWCTSALAVRYAVARCPGAEVAYLKDILDKDLLDPVGNLRFIHKAHSMGAQAVSAYWLAIDAFFVAAAHDLGLKVYSYHGALPLTQDKLTAGLDGLITDLPVQARQALRDAGVD